MFQRRASRQLGLTRAREPIAPMFPASETLAKDSLDAAPNLISAGLLAMQGRYLGMP